MEKYIKIPRFLKHIKIGDEMEKKDLKKKSHTQADLTPKNTHRKKRHEKETVTYC